MTLHVKSAMTLQEALDTLRGGGELPALSEAIGVVISDPTTSLEGIMLGLRHPGFVAEQAALTLYGRTSRPLPDDRSLLATDPDEWTRWLLAQPCLANADAGTGSSQWDRLPTAPGARPGGMTVSRQMYVYLLLFGAWFTTCLFGGVAFYGISEDAAWAATPIVVATVCAAITGIIPLVEFFRLRARKSNGDFEEAISLQRVWDAVDQTKPTARDLVAALERLEAVLKTADPKRRRAELGGPARELRTRKEALQPEESDRWEPFLGDRSEAEGMVAPQHRFYEQMRSGMPSLFPPRRKRSGREN